MKVMTSDIKLTYGPHVFETPEDIIINSQLYDKNTMKPKQFAFFNTNYQTYYANSVERQISISGYYGCVPPKEPDAKKWVRDSVDSNVFYCIAESGTSAAGTIQYISKIRKKENTWEIEKSISPFIAQSSRYYRSTDSNYKILGQTEKYLLIFQCSSGNSYPNDTYARLREGAVIRVNKSDMTFIGVHQYDESQKEMGYYPIKLTESYLYLYRYLNGNIYISRYNIERNTMDDIYSNITANAAGVHTPGLSNIIKFKNKYYIMALNATYDKYAFYEFDINFITDIVVTKTYELTNDAKFPFHVVPPLTLGSNWLHYSLKNINNSYIAVTVHDNSTETHYRTGMTGEPANFYSSKGYHRHGVYKFISDTGGDSFVLQDVIDIIPSIVHMYGVLYLNEYIVVFLTNFGFSFYEFNLTTEKYEKRYDKAGVYYTIGFDSLNRFYAFDDKDVCEIYTNITACILNVDFERESYSYNNSEISTYVTVSVKNFLLQNVAAEVKLVLTGLCKFENNTKELVFTTPTSDIQIPVIITGGGDVDCYIKQTGVIQ